MGDFEETQGVECRICESLVPALNRDPIDGRKWVCMSCYGRLDFPECRSMIRRVRKKLGL